MENNEIENTKLALSCKADASREEIRSACLELIDNNEDRIFSDISDFVSQLPYSDGKLIINNDLAEDEEISWEIERKKHEIASRILMQQANDGKQVKGLLKITGSQNIKESLNPVIQTKKADEKIHKIRIEYILPNSKKGRK
jgi:hypothetical protein